MEASFWHERWEQREIGFHEKEVNTFLVDYISSAGPNPGSRVFVPLCGKSRDIDWLLASGYPVVGAELSHVAVKELFARLGVDPVITNLGDLEKYSASGIDVFVGDVFSLTSETLGRVDIIYDRAALVALPEGMRPRYAALLKAITGVAPQLLVTYEYDQKTMEGPPFSISAKEVSDLYSWPYEIELLDSRMEESLKGQVPACEQAWLLK